MPLARAQLPTALQNPWLFAGRAPARTPAEKTQADYATPFDFEEKAVEEGEEEEEGRLISFGAGNFRELTSLPIDRARAHMSTCALAL